MPVTACATTDSQRPVGDVWPLTVEVTDVDGRPAAVAPVITVTPPAGVAATPAVEYLGGGRYRATYDLAVAGRHVATATAVGYGSAAFVVTVVAPTLAGAMPAAADVSKYLGEHSWEAYEVADALAVETAAQASICVIPAYYPDDLRGALMRRCARNLGMRRNPLAQPVGDAEAGTTSFSPYDPEINRFERPHLRLLIA